MAVNGFKRKLVQKAERIIAGKKVVVVLIRLQYIKIRNLKKNYNNYEEIVCVFFNNIIVSFAKIRNNLSLQN